MLWLGIGLEKKVLEKEQGKEEQHRKPNCSYPLSVKHTLESGKAQWATGQGKRDILFFSISKEFLQFSSAWKMKPVTDKLKDD